MSAARLPPEPPAAPTWVNPARVGFETLIERGPVSVIILSAFDTGVPDEVRARGGAYSLIYGHSMVPPMHVVTDDMGVQAVMAFGPVERAVIVPWAAVVAIRSEAGAQPAPVTPGPTRSTRPTLKLVP